MSMSFQTAIVQDTRRQLHRLLLEKKRRRGLEDLRYFSKFILGYTDLTNSKGFHGEYCRHLQDTTSKYKLSLTPRGTLKSSIGTIAHSIQDIVKDPNIRILLASEGFKNSTAFLEEIKGHFEDNEVFRSIYGDFVGKKNWSGSQITVRQRTRRRKEPTISCAGVDVTKVGMHYDIIRVDDPHSDQNTTNQDQIDKVIRWYKLLLSLLDPHGLLFLTGTIWHYNDLYNYIINKERERAEAKRKPRFKVFQRDSFQGTTEELLNDQIPKSKLLWPQRLSADFLKDTFIEQGPYIFSCQYRLRPIDDETAIFKRSWITMCEPEDIPDNLNIYSTIDPMQDENGSDYLAVTTCGMDKDWKCYILDVRRIKADEHDTVEELFKVKKMWKPIRMGIETVAWQKTYMKYVQMLQIMKGYRLNIVPLKTDTRVSKKKRIKGMVPYWKAGLFVIPVKGCSLNNLTGGVATLVDELTRFPKTANDDTIDALAYMNQLTQRPGVIHILRAIPKGSFKAVRNRAIKGKKKKLGHRNVREMAHG